VWSSWSKLEKNKSKQLAPLDTSVVKKGNQDSSTKKQPLKQKSPEVIDINANRTDQTPVQIDIAGGASPNKKKRLKKKKTRKPNKLTSDAGGDLEESQSAVGEITEMENQLNAMQSRRLLEEKSPLKAEISPPKLVVSPLKQPVG